MTAEMDSYMGADQAPDNSPVVFSESDFVEPAVTHILYSFDTSATVKEVAVPMRLLPGEIPGYRSMLEGREATLIKLRVVIRDDTSGPSFIEENEHFLLMSSWLHPTAIDLKSKKLLHISKNGNLYAVPIEKRDMPPELSKYTEPCSVYVFVHLQKNSAYFRIHYKCDSQELELKTETKTSVTTDYKFNRKMLLFDVIRILNLATQYSNPEQDIELLIKKYY